MEIHYLLFSPKSLTMLTLKYMIFFVVIASKSWIFRLGGTRNIFTRFKEEDQGNHLVDIKGIGLIAVVIFCGQQDHLEKHRKAQHRDRPFGSQWRKKSQL